LYNQDMVAQPIEPAGGSGVTEVPASEARSRISDLLDAVANGEFVYLTKRLAAGQDEVISFDQLVAEAEGTESGA
jgi:hypothetical protein